MPPRSFGKGSLVWLLSLAVTYGAHAQVADSTAAADSLLILELTRELGATEPAAPAPPPQAAARAAPSLNPNISLIGDFRAWYASDRARNVDAELHEAEAALQSVVDPYARADVFISMGHAGDGAFDFELEEAYLTTLALPFRLQLKAGKFRSIFGKINRIHPHALPFIDVPAVYVNYFGEEGLNDQGLSLSWLLPNPHFFQDLTFEVTRGPGGDEGSFVLSEKNRLLYVAHLKNFWDLTENATLELGFSGAAGPNDENRTTWLGGLDLTYKWKPLQFNTYRSLTLQAEAFFSRKHRAAGGSVATWGFYALASWQLGRRWQVVGRYDLADLPDDPSWDEKAVSITLGFLATEFQKLELGARTASARGFDRDYQALVRAVFVIGAHGAHEY
jgi:hypothetical protein